jgi:hypothetical protein
MKNISTLFFVFLASCYSLKAQVIDEDILNASFELAYDDIEQFSEEFYKPGLTALVHAMSNGWYQTAKVKDKWKFDISLVSNITIADADSREFLFRESDYNSTSLKSGEPEAQVASILGENQPDISLLIDLQLSENERRDIELKFPNGIASIVNFMPTAFLQAGLGLGHGFEVKARYFPNLNYEDINAQFFGLGLQNEITKWANFKEDFPFHISAFVGYTNFNGDYEFTESDRIDDLDGKISSRANSWLFSGIISTKFSTFNFYGGLGYVSGHAETTTSAKGVYVIRENGEVPLNFDIRPYTVETSVSGARLNLGANVNLGHFNIFTDFSLQEFSTASLGLTYKIN